MYANIPVPSDGSVIGMEVDTAAFDRNIRSKEIGRSKFRGWTKVCFNPVLDPTKWTIVTGTTSLVFLLGNAFLLFFERLRLISYHIVDSFW